MTARRSTTNMQTIREAICSHRGGHENSTLAQLQQLWNSLDEKTRQEYLADLQRKQQQPKPKA